MIPLADLVAKLGPIAASNLPSKLQKEFFLDEGENLCNMTLG